MSKKNNKSSETLSKNEKIFLSRFRRNSQHRKNKIIETTDINLNTFSSNLDETLNNIINEQISTLNYFLNKLASNKNKKFEEFKNDISNISNTLFSLININNFAEDRLDYLKSELLKDVSEIATSDKAILKKTF